MSKWQTLIFIAIHPLIFPFAILKRATDYLQRIQNSFSWIEGVPPLTLTSDAQASAIHYQESSCDHLVLEILKKYLQPHVPHQQFTFMDFRLQLLRVRSELLRLESKKAFAEQRNREMQASTLTIPPINDTLISILSSLLTTASPSSNTSCTSDNSNAHTYLPLKRRFLPIGFPSPQLHPTVIPKRGAEQENNITLNILLAQLQKEEREVILYNAQAYKLPLDTKITQLFNQRGIPSYLILIDPNTLNVLENKQNVAESFTKTLEKAKTVGPCGEHGVKFFKHGSTDQLICELKISEQDRLRTSEENWIPITYQGRSTYLIVLSRLQEKHRPKFCY